MFNKLLDSFKYDVSYLNGQAFEVSKSQTNKYLPSFNGIGINLVEGHGALNIKRFNIIAGAKLHFSGSLFSGQRLLGVTSFVKGNKITGAGSLLNNIVDSEYLMCGNAILNSINGGYGFNDFTKDEINEKLKNFTLDKTSLENAEILSNIFSLDMHMFPANQLDLSLADLDLVLTGGVVSSNNAKVQPIIAAISKSMSTGTYNEPGSANTSSEDRAERMVNTVLSALEIEIKDENGDVAQAAYDKFKEELNDMIKAKIDIKNSDVTEEVALLINFADGVKLQDEASKSSELINGINLRLSAINAVIARGGSINSVKIISEQATEGEKSGLAIAWILGKALTPAERLKLMHVNRFAVGIMPEFYFGVSTIDFSLKRFSFDKIELSFSSPLSRKMVEVFNDYITLNFNKGCTLSSLGATSTKSRLVDHFSTKKDTSVVKKVHSDAKGLGFHDSFKAGLCPKKYSYGSLGTGWMKHLTHNLRGTLKLISASPFFGTKGVEVGLINHGGKYSLAFGFMIERFNFNRFMSSY
jgi:hypothetical protein